MCLNRIQDYCIDDCQNEADELRGRCQQLIIQPKAAGDNGPEA